MMHDRRILNRPDGRGRINLSKQIAEEQETWKKKKGEFMHGYDYKSSIENGLKKTHITQMYLGIMKIKVRIIPFTQGIGYIENARFCFKSQP